MQSACPFGATIGLMRRITSLFDPLVGVGERREPDGETERSLRS